jgi:hypothetical protein
MRGKKIAVLGSSVVLMITGGLPMSTVTLTTLTVAGGAALVTGCSSEKSDTRQGARTEARTAERTEQRVEDRN